jgi:hypothetical protein
MTAPADHTGTTTGGAAVRVSATALVIAVVAVAALVFAPAMPQPLRIAVLAASGVVAPLLTVVALLLLITAVRPLGRRFETAVVTATAVAFVADLLFVLSLSVSSDEGDVGAPRSAFGSLAWEFALASAAGFATLVGLLLYVLLRGGGVMRRRTAGVVSGLIAVIVAPLLVWVIAAPITTVLPALAVAVVALVRSGARASRPRLGLRPGPHGADSRQLVRRVRTLAAASLGYSAVVWVGAIGASVAATGTEGATSSLGTASGAAQLAVVPLLVAGAIVAASRAPAARPVWIGTAASVALVMAVSIAMVVGYTPDGDVFMRNLGLLSLAVGAWSASTVWALTPALSPAARTVACGVALLGGAVVYLFGAALSAGITLALASGFLVLGGARRLLRPSPATSPATLPASV